MRTITLLRHAKSSWEVAKGAAPLADKARPLSPRGVREAPRMGRWMATVHVAPDLILCSTAVRTKLTLALILHELPAKPPKTIDRDSLYRSDASSLLQAARALPDKISHVMFVGHNPGLHDLAALLIGHGDAADRAALRPKFPTTGVVVIDFDIGHWDDVAPGRGRLRHFMSPKRLRV